MGPWRSWRHCWCRGPSPGSLLAGLRDPPCMTTQISASREYAGEREGGGRVGWHTTRCQQEMERNEMKRNGKGGRRLRRRLRTRYLGCG